MEEFRPVCPICGSRMVRAIRTPFDAVELVLEGKVHYVCPKCGFIAAFKLREKD